MLQRQPAELPAIVGQHALDVDPVRLVRRQHLIMQHVDRGHRHLGEVQLGEGLGVVGIDDGLLVDLPDALDRPDVVGVLAEQVPGLRRFDVLLGIRLAPLPAAQEAQLAAGEHAAGRSHFPLQPQEALVAEAEAVAQPDVPHRRRRHADADEPEVLRDSQIAGRRIALGHLEDLLLELWRGLVGHPRPAPYFSKACLIS